MRVSDRLIFDTVTTDLQRNFATLFRLQQQISSGRKVNRPSDDPVAEAQILNADTSLSRADQWLRNIRHADSLLRVSESSMQAMQDDLHRIRELAVQMANSTYTAADRATAAQEVRQIYDHLISLGNSTDGGRYVFAGEQTTTKPFVDRGRTVGTTLPVPPSVVVGAATTLSLTVDGLSSTVTFGGGTYATGAALAAAVETAINSDPTLQTGGRSVSVAYETDRLVVTSRAIGVTSAVSVTGGSAAGTLGLAAGTAQAAGTYLGDSAETSVLTGSGTTVIPNLPGDRLFLGAGAAVGSSVLDVVGDLQVALETNDATGIQTALGNLDVAQNHVSAQRAVLGARLARLESNSTVLEDFKLELTRVRSELGDVDLAKVLSELTFRQTLMDASRAVTASMLQTSLLNFLR